MGALNIALMNDASLAVLHGRYLNNPSPTDVIAFDLRDDPGDSTVDGEILISVDRARAEAARRRLPVRQELLRYVIHGTLHLLGLDDATPAGRQRMRRAEGRLLKALSGAGSVKSPRRRRRKASARQANAACKQGQ